MSRSTMSASLASACDARGYRDGAYTQQTAALDVIAISMTALRAECSSTRSGPDSLISRARCRTTLALCSIVAGYGRASATWL